MSEKSFFDFFEAARVINLVSRPDRRRQTERELAKLGVQVGDTGRVRWFNAVKPKEAAGFTSPGSRGCYESHLSVLREARDSGCSHFLVIEDDFQATSLLKVHGAALAESLFKQPWGIAYFAYGLPPGEEAKIERRNTPTLIPYQRSVLTTCFYAVNQHALDPLVRFLEGCLTRPPGDPAGGPMFIDGAFQMFRDRNPDALTLLCVPPLAGQRSSRTDLHELRWFDRVPVVRSALQAARAIRAQLKSRA